MTEIEVAQIAEIMCTADGGCEHCASGLLERLDKYTDYKFSPIIDKVKAKNFVND